MEVTADSETYGRMEAVRCYELRRAVLGMEESMAGRMVLYRGSLKSCNYQCSYCPFSKHPMSERELAKDKAQWFSFVKSYEERAGAMGIRAMMIVPYGEAMIHSWYWEGLARMSALAETDGVGAQTNLSFPVTKSLENFVKMGGMLGKLRLWATFHPEMTTVSAFAEQCRQLAEAGVLLCAGSVGVPENLEVLRQLKAKLPEKVYLWVNKMDGLKRPYTEEEKEAFLEIDPYFIRELTPLLADANRCRERLFIEGDGKIHTCNISQILGNGWEKQFPEPKCNRKRCSCYLAYGGRTDEMNRILFGEYPLFRIPRRPKAVFFDIDGTLLPKEECCAGESEPVLIRACEAGSDVKCFESGKALLPDMLQVGEAGKDIKCAELGKALLPEMPQVCEVDSDVTPLLTWSKTSQPIQTWVESGIAVGLEALARDGVWLFFATTLPYEEAMKRCHSIRHLFNGGIFSGGSHIRLEAAGEYERSAAVRQTISKDVEKGKEYFLWLEEMLLPYFLSMQKKYCYRVLAYGRDERFYKLTLLRSCHKPWKRQEAEEIFRDVPVSGESIRFFIEGKCLQVVCGKADKAEGVKRLCQWLDISPEEAVAVGDSEEDAGMMALCGM